MSEVLGSSAANTLLILAAAQGKPLAVATDYGMQTGYLVGIDENSLVLFGPYRKGDEAYWTIIILSRVQPTYIEERSSLGDEVEEVREQYLTVAGPFVELCKEHIRQMQSPLLEEETS